MKMRRRNLVLLILGGLVVLALVGREVVTAMRDHLRDLDEQIATRRAEYEAALAEMAANKVFVQKWQDVGGFIDQPLAERQTEFTSYLQSLRKGLDFEFSVLGAPEGRVMEENPKFQVLNYQLDFVADLEDLVEFLDRLDRSERLLAVSKVSVTRKETGRYDYAYSGGRADYVLPLPSSKRDNLAVRMTVSIPAAQKVEETTSREATP